MEASQPDYCSACWCFWCLTVYLNDDENPRPENRRLEAPLRWEGSLWSDRMTYNWKEFPVQLILNSWWFLQFWKTEDSKQVWLVSFRACFCPCFSHIHSSYRDYTKPLFIAQHTIKLIFVFPRCLLGVPMMPPKGVRFYWSFPKEERNGVQVYEYRYVNMDIIWYRMGMSQNQAWKIYEKNSPKSTNSYVEKSLILKPPGLVSVHLHGTIFSHEVRDTNPSSSASCRSEMQNQRRCFFLKIQRARIFSS